MLAKLPPSLAPRLLVGGWVILGLLGLSQMFAGSSTPTPAKIETARLDVHPENAAPTDPQEVETLRRTVSKLAAKTAAIDAKLATLEASLGPATGAIPSAGVHATAAGKAASETPLTVKFGPLPTTGFGDANDATSPVPIASGDTTQTRFGIQLATVANRANLSREWQNALSRQSGTLSQLQPRVLASIAASGEQKWSLIAGPFGNVADAVKACARLRADGMACREAIFAGDPLPIR